MGIGGEMGLDDGGRGLGNRRCSRWGGERALLARMSNAAGVLGGAVHPDVREEVWWSWEIDVGNVGFGLDTPRTAGGGWYSPVCWSDSMSSGAGSSVESCLRSRSSGSGGSAWERCLAHSLVR